MQIKRCSRTNDYTNRNHHRPILEQNRETNYISSLHYSNLNTFNTLKHAFRGYDEIISKQRNNLSDNQKSEKQIQTNKNRWEHIIKLINRQNEYLKGILNSNAITSIAIPEKFIKVIQEEDPMEVVANLIDTKDNFLSYKVLKVEGSNWHLIIWKCPHEANLARTSLNNNLKACRRLLQEEN